MELYDFIQAAIGAIGFGLSGYLWGRYYSHRRAVRVLLWILLRHSTNGGNLRFNTYEIVIIKEAMSLVK